MTIDRVGQWWLTGIALAFALFVAMSADAAWRAIAAHPWRSALGASAVQIAVRATPASDLSAPAAGTTGTIALPPLPAAALLAPPAGPAVVAARPFAYGRASPLDRGRALECLTAAVYYEAASEPDAGQQAVAQVVLNRVRHPAFPGTVCGVVYQGSARAGCQFSFACDGAIQRVPSIAGWVRAARVAAAALAGRVYAPVGLATHYHTYAVTPAWNRALVMTDAVGAHFFHRWKGWWGTPAAFTRIYAGHEPLPGPAAAPAPPIPATVAGELLLPRTAATATTPMVVPTPPATASLAAGLAPAPDRLPPASAILDRWKDSGAPLR